MIGKNPKPQKTQSPVPNRAHIAHNPQSPVPNRAHIAHNPQI